MRFIGKVLAHDLFRVRPFKARKHWCIRVCGEPSRLWECIPASEREEAANDE
jgi:hypothetical protein